jgi:hypothetical protein
MDPQLKSALLTILVWAVIIILIVWGLGELGFSFHDFAD